MLYSHVISCDPEEGSSRSCKYRSRDWLPVRSPVTLTDSRHRERSERASPTRGFSSSPAKATLTSPTHHVLSEGCPAVAATAYVLLYRS